MTKYTKPTLNRLEELFKDLGYVIRYEKGSFNSGYCLLDENKIVVVNRFFDTDGRVNVLLDILSGLNFDESLINDKNRTFLKSLWKNSEESLSM